jgi:hypothetical protein
VIKIRNTALAAITLVSMSFYISASADAENLVFKISNDSSSRIVGFYVSSPSQKRWGENLFRGDSLAPDYEVEILIADNLAICDYDLRFRFMDGTYFEERNVDICDTREYSLED